MGSSEARRSTEAVAMDAAKDTDVELVAQPEHCEDKPGDVNQKALEIEVDDEWLTKEKQLVRKLDFTLLPMVWILYLFNYLDRNNIAQAKLDSFEADLGLVGSQFSTAVSILNVGYMLMQLPSNMILTRVRPSVFLPICICAWSCVSAATAGTRDFGGLVAVRFVLGITEAPFFPGAFYLLSCWYTKKELALRTAVLYSGLVLATAVSGLLAAAIFSGLSGKANLFGWQWLFIVEGAASFLMGIIAFVMLPDFPESKTGAATWLLSDEERRIALERIVRDQVSNQESNHSLRYGLKMAVTDFRVWIFAFILCSNHTAYGFNNFFPEIVKGFNLGSRTITLVCTAPPYLVGALASFGVAWSSDRRGERGWHISIPMGVAAVGYIISVSTLNVPARYFASFLYVSGCFGANSIVYTWAAGSVSQTPEKRACATAIINLTSQFGNIWSPFFFEPGDEPRYIQAMLLMIGFSVASIVGCCVMKWVLVRDNKKLLESWSGTGVRPNLYTL